jgi:hypothetical protein
MKLNGHRIEGPNRDFVVIPRGENEDIPFFVEAVLDMKPFEKMCPVPQPPLRKIQGVDVPNLEDEGYKAQVTQYSKKRLAWMVLSSLRATEGLEWDSVDLSDASTWMNFRDEMRDSGFSEVEIDRVVGKAIEVNGLSEAKIKAARDRFLLMREERLDESSSRMAAPVTTQSGAPANDSE